MLRVNKSLFESVVLAWSSLSRTSGMPSGRFAISMTNLTILSARSARFFKDFGRFGAENPKIFLVEGGLEVAAQGSGWFLSG